MMTPRRMFSATVALMRWNYEVAVRDQEIARLRDEAERQRAEYRRQAAATDHWRGRARDLAADVVNLHAALHDMDGERGERA